MAAERIGNGPVTVTLEDGRQRFLAELRRGDAAAGEAAVRAAAAEAGCAVLAVGPGRYHLLAPAGAPPIASADLRTRLAGQAAVIDLTGGYPVLAVAGPGAATLVRAAVPVAVDALPADSVVSTEWHGAPCQIRRTGQDAFEIAVPRSYLEAVQAMLP